MRNGIGSVVVLLCGLLLGCAQESTGPWQLDNEQSQISFVSTKAVDVAEVHRFTRLSGSVDEAGAAEVAIELASVDTLIPVRDERMRELLFQTQLFPQANLRASLDMAKYQTMQPGSSLIASESVVLDLHGVTAGLSADVLVTKVTAGRFVVASLRPVVVSAAAFNLADGLEELRTIAGLPSIGASVPVSFVLTFVRAP